MAKRKTKKSSRVPHQRTSGEIQITLPIGEGIDGYVARHVEVHLEHEQALVLHRLFHGCRGRELRNGRYVQSAPDTIRYLLEQV